LAKDASGSAEKEDNLAMTNQPLEQLPPAGGDHPANGKEQPADENTHLPQKSELDYELFIIVFTLFSLLVALSLMFLPLAPEAKKALAQINLLITVIFLADFIHLFRRAENKIAYMKSRGWLDLLGSLPVYPVFRLFRVYRMVVVWRELHKRGVRPIRDQIVQRRAQNALRYTGFTVLFVITLGTILVLQFESVSPNANILTEQEAIWWAIVTIATVGYGDYYPVTFNGRLVGIVMIIVGVGMFGVLSSYLAKNFLSPTRQESEDQNRREKEKVAEAIRAGLSAEIEPLKNEIVSLRAELSDIRQLLTHKDTEE
jgi:voltage-gated potassium channel